MTITVKLSDESIRDAIRQLRNAQEHLRWGVSDTVDMLAKEGADAARDAYGHFDDVYVTNYLREENEAVIATSGDANIIAEFGAGDATIETPVFENEPDTLVFKGSYSLLEGSKEYFNTGRWHFGGNVYTEVQPRLGLYIARELIKMNAVERAKGVIQL